MLVTRWLLFWTVTLFLPPILLGIIRQTRARFQGRVGASVLQPFFDLIKFLRKGETLSRSASWVFRSTAAVNFAVVLLIAILTPWLSFKPVVYEQFRATDQAAQKIKCKRGGAESGELGAANVRPPLPDEAHENAESSVDSGDKQLAVHSLNINGMSLFSTDPEQPAEPAAVPAPPYDAMFSDRATTGSDLFLIIYMFALARLFTVLAALDVGSVFGGFGASREVTIALLVEPAIILALASLGCAAQTSDLNAIFVWLHGDSVINSPSLWFFSGMSLFLATIGELSRMPVDDPSTQLELTMVHEAMTLENSGRNLALVQYTQLLKMTVLLGLASQCFLHGIGWFVELAAPYKDALSLVGIAVLAFAISCIESLTVKLRWTKVPEFIAYSVAMSLLCALIAIGGHR
jgi:formate hydrogenlyase subunit 4